MNKFALFSKLFNDDLTSSYVNINVSLSFYSETSVKLNRPTYDLIFLIFNILLENYDYFLRCNCNVTEKYCIKYIVKTWIHFIIKFAFNVFSNSCNVLNFR